ncbi:hypothetical protein IQ264_30825 [Phormidium sp. LEGE 05292]|uniref:hypothetical protein n=1 Tax=[Phormidium] sp. LEGE 05292 TaxID=767427 RepID=UPI00187FAAB0|nr:hypothetical protein [Phormidium sp. LEGE 05292]MBE9229801.1 hypothetical protein [Phormidium sp. LEGE 05292]
MSDDSTNKTEDSNFTSTNTEKITKLSGLGKKIKIVSIIIWSIVVLLVLIPLLGQLIISRALAAELTSSQSIKITQPLIAFYGEKAAVNKALNIAHQSAEKYAKNELNKWETELIRRIDNDFLNWYFSYFNQKKREFTVVSQYIGENVMNGFNQSIVNDKIAQKINDEIQREFAKRVLQRESAEIKFNTIVMNTLEFYIQEISQEFNDFPKKYKIPQTDWDKYLKSINIRLQNEQGNQVSVVTFIGAMTATGSAKIAATFAAKASSKAIAAISVKVGSMIDPAVAIVLIAWDYWDYTNGVKDNKPRLREDLVEYLHNLKKSLLSDPEHSVMSAVNELEQAIKTSLLQSIFPA